MKCYVFINLAETENSVSISNETVNKFAEENDIRIIARYDAIGTKPEKIDFMTCIPLATQIANYATPIIYYMDSVERMAENRTWKEIRSELAKALHPSLHDIIIDFSGNIIEF